MPETTPMLTTGDALLRDVVENPADDTPRLILADWCEEHGDFAHQRHAVFIRAQFGGRRPESIPLNAWRFFKELLPDYGVRSPRDDWTAHEVVAEFCPFDRESGEYHGELIRATFRRGFVEEVTVPLAVWQKHGGRLVAASPVVKVRVSDHEPFPLSGDGPEFPTRYSWWLDVGIEPQEGDTSDLPADVFHLLQGGEPKPRPADPLHRDYDTPGDAHNALGAVCLKIARKEAGLP